MNLEMLQNSIFFVQGLGFLAFILSILSYQFEAQKTMYKLRVSSDSLWTLHYLLLGAITPALTVLVACVRTLLVVFVFPKHRTFIIILAITTVVALCVYNYKSHWAELLPILPAVLYGISNYFHEDYVKSRILVALGLCAWFAIGFIYGSYAEMLSSSFGIISILIGFHRHKKPTMRSHSVAE